MFQKCILWSKSNKMLQKLQKLKLLQCSMGGPRAASYIHAQCSTFLLLVDEKCCSWPLSLRLNNCTTFWKQLNFCMVSIFAKDRICRGNTYVHLQFFLQIKTSRHRKTELLRKWIALVLQVKFPFMSCLHCTKSVQIRSYFWSVFSCIRIEYGDLIRKSRIQS